MGNSESRTKDVAQSESHQIFDSEQTVEQLENTILNQTKSADKQEYEYHDPYLSQLYAEDLKNGQIYQFKGILRYNNGYFDIKKQENNALLSNQILSINQCPEINYFQVKIITSGLHSIVQEIILLPFNQKIYCKHCQIKGLQYKNHKTIQQIEVKYSLSHKMKQEPRSANTSIFQIKTCSLICILTLYRSRFICTDNIIFCFQMSQYSYLFKCIIIGDSSVGKSCLLLNFLDKKFKLDHDNTIGVEFGSKTINVKDKNIKLQIWDTAGQESFKSITRSYYRGSICGFIVYDITQKDTFENVNKWIEETRQFANEKTSLILVGNKHDLSDKREVSYDQGAELAKKHNIMFIETSAKTGYNVEQVFLNGTELVMKKIENREIDPTNEAIGIRIGSQVTDDMLQRKKDQEKKRCC